ncbi:hypothetical protein MRX96_019580 [Rhipicephalus microplus]
MPALAHRAATRVCARSRLPPFIQRGAPARASACACSRSRTHCGIAHVAACNELRNQRLPKRSRHTRARGSRRQCAPVAVGCKGFCSGCSIQVRRRDNGLHRCGRALSVPRNAALLFEASRRTPSPGHATSGTCAPPRATNVAMRCGDLFHRKNRRDRG